MTALTEFWFRWGAICWLVAVSALVVLLSLLNINTDNWIYQRDALSNEAWRAITHGFFHLNTTHMMLNLLTLWLVFLVFQKAFNSSVWVIVLVFCSIASTLGLYHLSTDIEWVAGLSGPLHGLFVYAVLRSAAHWLWGVMIFLKLVIEQVTYADHSHWLTTLTEKLPFIDFTSKLINADVVVDAHLWGAIGGLFVFLVFRLLTWLSLLSELNRA